MNILQKFAAVFLMSSSFIPFVLGKCIKWGISCGEGEGKLSSFYIGTSSTQYSDGQTLSISEYNTVLSVGCSYCFSDEVSSCPTVDATITLVCTKTAASSSTLIEAVENEKFFAEVLLALWVLAFLVFAPPPLPKIVPLGVPQPVQLTDSFSPPTGGGILPKDALAVSIQICRLFTSFISICYIITLSNEDL